MSNILKNELAQFTGTEKYYFNPLFRKFNYTDGVRYLAEKGGAYWLLDFIFSHQRTAKIAHEQFQVWTIKLKENGGAKITVEDGNKNVISTFNLTFTDFPLQEYSLWLVGKTLILPSEY